MWHHWLHHRLHHYGMHRCLRLDRCRWWRGLCSLVLCLLSFGWVGGLVQMTFWVLGADDNALALADVDPYFIFSFGYYVLVCWVDVVDKPEVFSHRSMRDFYKKTIG